MDRVDVSQQRKREERGGPFEPFAFPKKEGGGNFFGAKLKKKQIFTTKDRRGKKGKSAIARREEGKERKNMLSPQKGGKKGPVPFRQHKL